MAAATGALVAIASTGLSISQAVESNKEKKKAQQAAAEAANQMKSVTEKNAYNDIQLPTLGFELAQQSADRQMQAALQTAQGAGAEAVIGSVPGMMQVGAEQQLQLAAMGNQAQMDLALQKAQAQQGVNFREATAQRDFAESQLIGAQLAASQAEENRQEAIKNAVQGFSQAVGSAGKAYSEYEEKRVKNPASKEASPYKPPTMPRYRTAANQGIVTGQSQFANVPVSPNYGVPLAPQPTSAYSAFMYP